MRAQKHCSEQNESLAEVIERGLTLVLEGTEGQFANDGQLIHDWSEIRDIIYEGRGT